jgi:hypothetical protein
MIVSDIFKRNIQLMEQGKSREGLYENVLAESEREAVADLLQYLENVRCTSAQIPYISI